MARRGLTTRVDECPVPKIAEALDEGEELEACGKRRKISGPAVLLTEREEI
jgi:hypothetical protein